MEMMNPVTPNCAAQWEYFLKSSSRAPRPKVTPKPPWTCISINPGADGGWIKQVTLAPELDGVDEIAKFLQSNGVCPALGHSNADFNTASHALDNNFTHITHTYNAQSPFHHRQPGVVGAILTSDHATAELIADGLHVHPAAMRVLVRCLGVERIVLITDAMPGAGLPDGTFNLLGRDVCVSKGKALLPDGTLAGSTATMDICVRKMVHLVGTSLPDVIRMASLNPAAVIGVQNDIGSISTGKQADIAVFDKDLKIIMTIRNGKIIYQESSHGK